MAFLDHVVNLDLKRSLLLALTVPLLGACSKQEFFSEAGKPGSGGDGAATGIIGQRCQDVKSIQKNTKILFVVDTSGSNVKYVKDNGVNDCDPRVTSNCTPPTDPNKSFRGGAIESFFKDYKAKTNFSWGFVTFSNGKAQSLISGNALTNEPSVMQSAIDAFYKIVDIGSTPYDSALRLAKSVIENDPERNSSSAPQYVVIFISDGYPTDSTQSQIVSDISSLRNIKASSIRLSAIYYGQVMDPNAVSLLKSMAAAGGGNFANANDFPNGFKIEDVIPGQLCQ